MQQVIWSDQIRIATGHPFDVDQLISDAGAVLSDESPSSSHGIPVVVYKGQPYGPSDLNGVRFLTNDQTDLVSRALEAGYEIEVAREEA